MLKISRTNIDRDLFLTERNETVFFGLRYMDGRRFPNLCMAIPHSKKKNQKPIVRCYDDNGVSELGCDVRKDICKQIDMSTLIPLVPHAIDTNEVFKLLQG